MRNGLLLVGVMTALAAQSGCSRKASGPSSQASSATPAGPSADRPQTAPSDPIGEIAGTYSNILGEDYVGPQACGKCHQDNYSRWNLHPHSRMNQLASAGSVLGNFSGASLPYADGKVVFKKDNDQFVMEYLRRGKRLRSFKVTRTIGWRYLQEYVGVQIEGPEPPQDPLYTQETRLKFGYVLKTKKWLPQSYYDAPYIGTEFVADGHLRYDPFDPERDPFNSRCIHCHNTYPYEVRLYTGGELQGFPPAPVRLVEALLERRPDHAGQRQNPCLEAKALVTVGISCESCHFGGREHSSNVKKAVRFVPTHPLLAEWTPDPRNARKNPAVVNSICRQCHFSGTQSWADGSAYINSMESIEQDRGACAGKLKCTDCHNPHVRGPEAGAPDRPEHLAACVGCHERLKAPAAARAHGRHDPAAVSCLDCHMPRIVHGFDEINRSHRISSPTEPGLLSAGMPNACNLCHLDRSLAWTRDSLKEGWGRSVAISAGPDAASGKDPSKPAGEVWLDQSEGMLRMVAGAAYARSPLGKLALPRLLKSLEDPNAYLRTRSLEIVERVLGRPLEENEYTLTGSPQERHRQVQELLRRF
jgi:hypothetical protein